MSAARKNIYAPLPNTTRGRPTHMGGDPKGENMLYTCGNSVIIRSLKNPLIADMYNEHQKAPTAARYAPSGFYIASADMAGTVRIWDTTQAEHPLKIELRVLGGQIYDLAWSPDSKRIVVAGDGREKYAHAFFADSGASVGEISQHFKTVTTCDMKQTRPFRVATGGDDFLVNWYEGPPFKFKKHNKDHERFVNCVRFSPNGELLVSVAQDKKGLFYDGKTGERKHNLSTENAHKAGIYSCAWSADSTQLFTASGDKTCKLWDVETGNCVTTWEMGTETNDQQLGCLWQGDFMISLSLSGQLKYVDKNSGKVTQTLQGHSKFVTSLTTDTGNGNMYSGSYDASLTRWNIETGANADLTGKGHSNQINDLAIVGDKLVSGALDDSVHVTPVGGNAYTDDSFKVDGGVNGVAGHGSTVVAAHLNGLTVANGASVTHTQSVGFVPLCVAVSVDGTEVAVGGDDHKIHLYSLSGGKLSDKGELTDHRGPVTAVAYSPDGKYMASGDKKNAVFLWEGGKLLFNGWVYHTAKITSVAFSPDSSHVVSGSLDSNIYVWSVAKRTNKIPIKNAHWQGVNKVAWLDNTTVVSAGQDCTVKTWTVTLH